MPDAPIETPKAAVPPWEAKSLITRRSLSRKVVFWSVVGALVLVMVYALQPRPAHARPTRRRGR